jgi:hypothetical protein
MFSRYDPTEIVTRTSFTNDVIPVCTSLTVAARRSNLAAIIRQYRAAGYRVTVIETGAMYNARLPKGFNVNIWYRRGRGVRVSYSI